MISFLVVAVAIGVVAADVSSLGYHYKVPQTSYGVPSYQVGGSSNYNTGYTQNAGSVGAAGYNYKGQAQTGYQGLNAGQVNNAGYQYQGSSSSGSGYLSAPSGGQSGYQGLSVGQSTGYRGNQGYTVSQGSSGNQGYTGYQGASSGSGYQGVNSGSSYKGASAGTGYVSSGGASAQYYPSVSSSSSSSGSDSLVQPTYQVSGVSSGQGAFQYQSQYQTAHQQKYQYQYQQQPAQVFKHFYVHAAPEEPEEVKTRNPVLLPAPQKHYKIIFIKTPSQAGGSAPVFPVQQQNEEKTIVYVLVKKPEDYQDVAIPKIEQKPPSKPEVYFIKYKNKEDSQAVINNIVSDYNNGQNSVSFSGAGADTLQSGSSSFTGQINTGAVGFSSGGSSFAGQTEESTGSVSLGSAFSQGAVSSGNSFGGYSEQTQVSPAQSFSQGTESNFVSGTVSSLIGDSSQGISSGSSGFGQGALSIATAETSSVSSGYDAIVSSTANYENLSTISTSQGVPHETYGVPKFNVQ